MNTQPTITLRQAEAIIKVADTLRDVFADNSPEDTASVLTLFIHGRTPVLDRSAHSKGDQLIEMLRRPKGASLDEVIETFGIKKNSAYARISVETRRRGLHVEHANGRYHIPA